MKQAVIRFKRIIRITESESNLELRAIYLKCLDGVKEVLQNVRQLEPTRKKPILEDATSFVNSHIKNYLKDASGIKLHYTNYEVIEISNEKNFPTDSYVEVALTSDVYTILDSIGNKMILKKGDLSDTSKKNLSKISDALFFEPQECDSIFEYTSF